MTDPTKALADAARNVQAYVRGCIADRRQCDEHWISQVMGNALAAYDAAQATKQVPPTDEEIEVWVKKIIKARHDNDSTRFDEQILTGCDLMRRASPCAECDGTGTVEKCDWPGEHANRYQEPCPACARPSRQAPLDSSLLQAAKAVLKNASKFRFAAPVRDEWIEGMEVDWDVLAALRAEVERASKGGAHG